MDIIPNILIKLTILVTAVVACWYMIKSMRSKNLDLLVLFASLLSPIAWLVVFHGHIYVHIYWDYRIFGPMLCAVGVLLYIFAVVVRNRLISKKCGIMNEEVSLRVEKGENG